MCVRGAKVEVALLFFRWPLCRNLCQSFRCEGIGGSVAWGGQRGTEQRGDHGRIVAIVVLIVVAARSLRRLLSADVER